VKVSQFCQVLNSAGEIYRDCGNVAVADALTQICELFAGRETMSVAKFAEKVAEIPVTKAARPSTS
jgi:hypothetical protein